MVRCLGKAKLNHISAGSNSRFLRLRRACGELSARTLRRDLDTLSRLREGERNTQLSRAVCRYGNAKSGITPKDLLILDEHAKGPKINQRHKLRSLYRLIQYRRLGFGLVCIRRPAIDDPLRNKHNYGSVNLSHERVNALHRVK